MNVSPYLELPVRTLEQAKADRAKLAAERARVAAINAAHNAQVR